MGRGESPASWGPAAVAGSLVFIVLLLWGGQCFLCHRQHLVNLSSWRATLGPGASIPPNTGLSLAPSSSACQSLQCPAPASGAAFVFLGISPTIPPAHTLPPPWPAQDFGRKLSSTMEILSNTSFPSPVLPGEIKTLQGMILHPLLCPGRALRISFPRSVGALLKEDLMVGFLVHPPWQLPRGKGLPFVRRAMRVPVGTGL